MTVTLTIKNNRYYAVINYKDSDQYKQKWIALGLPVKNNKRKAEAMLEQIKREYDEAYSTPGGDMPFVSYIKQWLYNKKATIELSTWESYQTYTEKHIIPYFEPMKLSLRDLKSKHIKEYYEHKVSDGRLDGKAGGLSVRSIKSHGVVLKESLNDAVLTELISRNPATGVKIPTKVEAKRKYAFLTIEQANKMLKAFDGHPLQALVYTTIYYGLRRSEVLGLRWSAIDFDNRTMTINHTVVKNKTIVAKDATKTQSSFHTYQLIDDVKDVLLAQKAKQEENKRLLGSGYCDSDYVFVWDDGTRFRPDYITRGFQRVLAANGLPMMRFHDLRHSTASILYDKGWEIKDIQLWLRHSCIDVTADIYTHISENRKASMASSLNSTFKL